MEKDLTVHRSSYFSGGCMTVSPSSCFAVHDEFQYSRIHYGNTNNNSPSISKRGGRWRNLLRRFMREGKTVCGSKPLSFQYDPVSYSRNFDDGCHLHEPRRLPLLFRAATVLDRLESAEKSEYNLGK